MTFLSVGLLLMGTVWAAMTLADHTSAERSVASVMATFWRLDCAPAPRAVAAARLASGRAGWLVAVTGEEVDVRLPSGAGP